MDLKTYSSNSVLIKNLREDFTRKLKGFEPIDSEFIKNRDNRAFYNQIGILEEPEKVINSIKSSDEYKKALKYCTMLFKKRKSINKRHSSYGLKHVVEEYISNHKLENGDSYISNDEFILAMHELGFQCKKSPLSQNYYFNVESLNKF
jgi:hypothetical protein